MLMLHFTNVILYQTPQQLMSDESQLAVSVQKKILKIIFTLTGSYGSPDSKMVEIPLKQSQ